MREETLNKIRVDYDKQLQIKDNYNDIKSRIDVLEENPLIQEYRALKTEAEKVKKHLMGFNDTFILDSIRDKYLLDIEEDGDKLFVYCDSIYYSRIANEILKVRRNSENEDFRRYVDLETNQIISIFKTEWTKFEDSDNVIVPVAGLSLNADYSQWSAKYISLILKLGKDKARQLTIDYFTNDSISQKETVKIK